VEREAAIAALISLEQVDRIAVASLKPTDVVVVELSESISDHATEHINRTLSAVFPKNKIVVCDQGTKIKIVNGEQQLQAADPEAADDPPEGAVV